MRVLVVYESVYGNTREVAEAVRDGLTESVDVTISSVHEAGAAADVDLLVVGGPTHMHGLTTASSRRMAVTAAREDSGSFEAGAGQEPGLRPWLHELPRRAGGLAATFDTRLDRSAVLTGSAARGIARRLRHHGYDVVATESFLVDDAEGPLADGELERARTWGLSLARKLEAASSIGPASPSDDTASFAG